jgi:hypothetical protein
MKIDLSLIDQSMFMKHPHMVAGDICWLVQPQHVGCAWHRDNMIFRSSLWNNDGELISAGLKKFMNLGEKPDCYPDPEKHKDWNVLEKKDGTLLIISKYKGEMIYRTRGTVDARKIDNGYEIDYLLQKYPKIIEKFAGFETAPFSILCEWQTPTNVIVIKVDEPQLFLVGGVNHDDYSIFKQKELDELSIEIGVPRPQRFSFNTISEALSVVKEFKNMEGVCLYFNKDQNIVKLKGDWYLKLHRLKSELGDIEHVLDLYLNQNEPSFNEFYEFICNTMDFEIAEQIRPFMSKIVDAKREVSSIVEHMKKFIEPLKAMSRKDAALKIQSAYGKTNRCSYGFQILDGRELNKESLKKLYFQILKIGKG